MNKVSDYIFIANVIPKDLCESLIDECNTKEWKKHTWYDYGTNQSSSMPEKELDVMPCTQDQQNKITPHLIKALEDYQNKYAVPGDKTGTQWLTKFSPIRFNKYVIGTTMRKHYDHIHSIFDGKMKGVPIISIVGQLNEDYEGAEFYCRDKEIKLKTGDILLFPSNFMYPHEVKETKKGVRYSFVSWAF